MSLLNVNDEFYSAEKWFSAEGGESVDSLLGASAEGDYYAEGDEYLAEQMEQSLSADGAYTESFAADGLYTPKTLPYVLQITYTGDEAADSLALITLFDFDALGSTGYSATNTNGGALAGTPVVSVASKNASFSFNRIVSQISREPVSISMIKLFSSNESNINQIASIVRTEAAGTRQETSIPFQRDPQFFTTWSIVSFGGGAFILDNKTAFKLTINKGTTLDVWLYYANKAALGNELVGGSTIIRPVGLPSVTPVRPWAGSIPRPVGGSAPRTISGVAGISKAFSGIRGI